MNVEVGILDCLQKYQEELSGDCKDAFLATSKAMGGVIAVLNEGY